MSMRTKWSIYLLLIFNFLLLTVFVGSDFYSLYTDHFYITKKENFITLLLFLPYLVYLVVIGIKVQQEEATDPAMRNLEYLVYLSLIGGIWQVWQVFSSWSEFSTLQNQYLLPEHFYLIGLSLLITFALFYVFSLYLFSVRKRVIGPYHRREWEENFDAWEEFRLGQETEVPVEKAD